MPNVGAEFTASIVIDKNDLITQALKQLSTAQKELEKNKLEIYFDLSNADLSKKLKEYQKQLSSTDYTIKINNNGIEETYKSLDKLLDIVKTIASGKDFGTGFGNINADNAIKQIDKLENRISELTKKYEELQKKSSSTSGNISGKDINLIDNEEFKKLSANFEKIKGEVDDLKTHMNLLSDSTVSGDSFLKLGSQVDGLSAKLDDLLGKYVELSNVQNKLGGNKTNISLGNTTEIKNIETKTNAIQNQTKAYREWSDAIKYGVSRMSKAKELHDAGLLPYSDVDQGIQSINRDKLVANQEVTNNALAKGGTWSDFCNASAKYVESTLEKLGMTSNQFKEQIKAIDTIETTDYWKNISSGGWTRYGTSNENNVEKATKELNYKIYAAFENAINLTKENISEILNRLQKEGFVGQLKTNPSIDTIGETDQIVIHGRNEIDQQIAYNVLKAYAEETGKNFSFLDGGFDQRKPKSKSFSTLLGSGAINIDDYQSKYGNAINQQENLKNSLKETESQAEKTAQAVKEVSSTASQNQMKDAIQTDNSDTIQKQVEANNSLATANENVQKAVEGVTSAIKENAQVIDNGEMPSIDELIKKANEAAYALTKGKDIVSQTGKRQVYKTTEITDDGKTREGMAGSFSYVERTQAGQLKSIQATFDEAAQKWREETTSLVTYFNQVEKAIISADNKINSLENDRAKTLAAHPGYDTSADDALIASEQKHRDELQKTLDTYATEKEYVYQIEAANKRIAENQQRLTNISVKKENLRNAISDEQFNKDWDAAIAENNKRDAETAKQLAKELDNAKKAALDLADAKKKVRQTDKDSTQSSVDNALKDQVTAWKNIQSIREKIAKTKDSDEIANLQQIKKEYQQNYIEADKILKANSSLYDKEIQVAKLEQIRVDTNKKIADYQISQVSVHEKKRDSYISKLTGYTDTSKYTSDFVNRANTLKTELVDLKFTNPQDITRLQEIDSEVVQISNYSKLLENRIVKQQSKLAEIISQMKIFKSQNTNMSGSQKAELDKIINYAETMQQSGKEVASEVENIKVKFAGLKAEVHATGNTGKNFFSQIGDRLTDMNSKFVAQFLSWQDWIRYIQQAAQMVIELNSNITELAKVSEQSSSQIYADFDSYADIAKKVRGTISDTIAATADWSKNGYSIPDAKELAEVSQLYKNVGDGINIDEANESLISTLKGFKLEADEAEHIVDVFNEVDLLASYYSNVIALCA